ncbi:class I ribonucleotide reductase maintenance protein YfaE [Achromobacter spanius]|uniref:class I ribonucleotide reductase maintenance protein YfaE n=1 Tax=Achromobacter spanius TaxID=217203 RepID=UPI0038066C08
MTRVETSDAGFELLNGESLLEGLERTGHHVEYQCRSGYCGTCRLTLTSGAVTYASPPLAYLGPREILPCCCTPQGSISIECWQLIPT